MNSKLLILVSGFISILFSCKNIQSDESNINNYKKIFITGKINNLLQTDSIFACIKTVPLETKNECLIMSPEKAMFFGDRMFIQNGSNNLFVFDTTGNFLLEFGKKGRGPGEFLELRDFDIDENGFIYILDFLKILKYNPDGNFVEKYSFRFSPTDKILCNPMQFALKKNGNFLLWAGSLGIRENHDNKAFIMYEMTNKGKIVNSFFPLKYKLSSDYNQFKHYNNLTLIDPIFGSNSIYSIKADQVELRYVLDFGGKNLNVPVPENFETLTDFKLDIDAKYYHTICGFTETNNWIYFRFLHKQKFFNVYYSKELNKSFISSPYPRIKGRIAPWMILSNFSDKFIALIEPQIVIEDMNQCKDVYNSIPQFDRKIIESLNEVKLTDNPILFICSMRKY